MLGENMLFRNYKTDKQVDELIQAILQTDFEIIGRDEFFLYIETHNISVKLWNHNKYYAWLNAGKVYDKANNKLLCSWSGKMPKRFTIFRFAMRLRHKFKASPELMTRTMHNWRGDPQLNNE